MKVAVVAGAIHRAKSGVYGSEAQSAVLARGFERNGHEVTFIAAAGSDRVGKFLPVPCMYGKIWPNEETKEYEWYRDVLLEQDLILDWSGTHRVTENLCFWDRAKFKGVLIWNHQGNVFTSPRPPACTTYHGVVVSRAQKEHALAHWLFNTEMPPAANIHVIPYGIDTETFHPVDGTTRDYFLYLSRPHPHKGIFDFVQLAREFPGERFVMAFDMAAPDHREYGTKAIEEAKEVPNLEYVALKGSQEKKVELYQHAKALVAPLAKDYTEGFGLVFAEAMACGTPCITATHGGQVDVVGPHGFLCETHEQYVDAIRSVVLDDDRRGIGLMGQLARLRILRKFSVERQVLSYLKLYAKVRRELDTPPFDAVPGWLYA